MNNDKTNPTEETKKALDEKQLEEVSGGDKWMTDEEFLETAKKMAEWVPDKKTDPFDLDFPDFKR